MNDYQGQIQSLPVGDANGNPLQIPSPYNLAAHCVGFKRGGPSGDGVNNSNLDGKIQRDAYGLSATSKNLNALLPDEMRSESRQSELKK